MSPFEDTWHIDKNARYNEWKMKLFSRRPAIANATDSSLVLYSLGGDRDAFCQIVTRYQNLLCSIAFSSLGDIKHSEDVAQETFVDAWRKLDTLQDHNKLKAWLCGILRFKISHHRRKDITQPVTNAEEFDEQLLAQEEEQLEQKAINKEQQELLWLMLDKLDEKYREPLVLFYREQQSVEKVAEELDLSKDTAKQRLSRGRKLLKEAMSGFVENALKSSIPGVAFTTGVMTIISTIAPPAKAAAITAGVGKSTSIFSFTTVVTFLAVVSGLISSFFGLQANLAQSRTERERKFVLKSALLFVGIALMLVVSLLGLTEAAIKSSTNLEVFAAISQAVVLLFIIAYLGLVKKLFAASRKIRRQERIIQPQAFESPIDQPESKNRDYKSSWSLFGVPFIHVKLGMHEDEDEQAFGWIAGGTKAKALLFAWGGIAVAPISVGIISVGIFTIGVVGFGLLGLGTVAIGVIAFGASAIGIKAYGSLSALGWESAVSNGFSIANEAAIGKIAVANIVNNQQAEEMVQWSIYITTAPWLLAIISIFVIFPSALYARKVKKAMGERS